jgi:hypothetical protein
MSWLRHSKKTRSFERVFLIQYHSNNLSLTQLRSTILNKKAAQAALTKISQLNFDEIVKSLSY